MLLCVMHVMVQIIVFTRLLHDLVDSQEWGCEVKRLDAHTVAALDFAKIQLCCVCHLADRYRGCEVPSHAPDAHAGADLSDFGQGSTGGEQYGLDFG